MCNSTDSKPLNFQFSSVGTENWKLEESDCRYASISAGILNKGTFTLKISEKERKIKITSILIDLNTNWCEMVVHNMNVNH